MPATPVSDRTLRLFAELVMARMPEIAGAREMVRAGHFLTVYLTDEARASVRSAILAVSDDPDAVLPDDPERTSIAFSIEEWAARWRHANSYVVQASVVERVIKHLQLVMARMLDPYPALDDVFPHVMAKLMTAGQVTEWSQRSAKPGSVPRAGECPITLPHMHWAADMVVVACIDSEEQIAICSPDLLRVWNMTSGGVIDLGIDNLRRHSAATPPNEATFDLAAFLADRGPSSIGKRIDQAIGAIKGLWKKPSILPDEKGKLPLFMYDKHDGHAASRLLVPDTIMAQVKSAVAAHAKDVDATIDINDVFMPLLAMAPDRDTLVIFPFTPASVVVAVDQCQELYQAARYPISPLPFLIVPDESGEIRVTSFLDILQGLGGEDGPEMDTD